MPGLHVTATPSKSSTLVYNQTIAWKYSTLYGYKTHKGKEDCKVQGITLNSLGKRYVNFEVLKNNVLEDLTSPLESGKARVTTVPIPFKIVRNAQYQLSTTAQQKLMTS